MMSLQKWVRWAAVIAVATASVLAGADTVSAHGERAQEPYLRTRTMQFYDVHFSKTDVKVNEEFEVTGSVRLMEDWPDAVSNPDTVFLSVVSPGPVVARVESWLDGQPARQSFRLLKLGRDYAFRVVLKGRTPGNWHLHPSLSIKGSGPLIGPGQWVNITGSQADFVYPLTTSTKVDIPDLQTYGLVYAMSWHAIWFAIAAFWLLFWLVRPLLLPRWIALRKGREDLLISLTDVGVGLAMAVVVLFLTFGGYTYATTAYAYNVPLQSGTMRVEPLPSPPANAEAKVTSAKYDVPGRSMKIVMTVTNHGRDDLTIGELTTANIRFVNAASAPAMANVAADYPKELVARSGLLISDPSPIKPGETREITLEATDAVWETERLVSFLTDVDSKFGALLILYSPTGQRNIAEVGGPIVPYFTSL